MNVANLIVVGLVVVAAILAIRHLRKNKDTCGCGCSTCQSSCCDEEAHKHN